MLDPTFRSRIRFGVITFSNKIIEQGAASNFPLVSWAVGTADNPETNLAMTQQFVVLDPHVQDQGADISDPVLQVVIEGVVQSKII